VSYRPDVDSWDADEPFSKSSVQADDASELPGFRTPASVEDNGMVIITAPAAAASGDASPHCPCLGGLPYLECCGPFHRGAAAPTAERLMRSRYSAYAIGLADYLLDSWHPTTRPAAIELDDDVRWYRLDILARSGGGILDRDGTVEFEAHYRLNGTAGVQHELSRFLKEDGRWFYLDAA
jgi:SEC-C motif-containing protein